MISRHARIVFEPQSEFLRWSRGYVSPNWTSDPVKLQDRTGGWMRRPCLFVDRQEPRFEAIGLGQQSFNFDSS